MKHLATPIRWIYMKESVSANDISKWVWSNIEATSIRARSEAIMDEYKIYLTNMIETKMEN